MTIKHEPAPTGARTNTPISQATSADIPSFPTPSALPDSGESHGPLWNAAFKRYADLTGKGSTLARSLWNAMMTATKLPVETVVFDLETSGLSPAWDQILQFAAVRAETDKLVIEDMERDAVNLRCRIRQEVIPSPAALVATRVFPHMLEEAPLRHDELMFRIDEFLTSCLPAVFLGHNAIRFDSQHLRHNLFSQLLPPYTLHMDGSLLVDTLLLAHLIHALDPVALTWPRKPDGKLSFRLGDLCAANGITLDPNEAHDALADVGATLDLYRLMRARSPAIFALGNVLASKQVVAGILQEEVLGIIRVTGAGAAITPVTVLPVPDQRRDPWPPKANAMTLPNNPNGIVAFDLRVDPNSYLNLGVDAFEALLAGKASPLRNIRINAMPLLIPLDLTDAICPEAALGLRGIDPGNDAVSAQAELVRRAERLRDNPGFRDRLKIVLERRDAARPTSAYLEEQLYAGGFAPAQDFFEGLRMHRMDPKYRHLNIGELSDHRLRTHAFRMIHAIAPGTLDPEIRAALDKWLRERLTATGDVPWMTIQKALDNTETLRRDITDEADRLACVLFPDPHPTERCPDTGAWIEDLAAVEDIERSRAAFIEAHAGHDLVLLDDYEIWLKAKLEVIPRG